MPKKLWTAHHKGQTFTRSASQRTYSHVIVNEFADGRILAAAWCGNYNLAYLRRLKEARHQLGLNRTRDAVPKVIITEMIACQLEDAPAKVRR